MAEKKVLGIVGSPRKDRSMPFMNYDLVDEILFVAKQLMEVSKEKGMNIEKAKMEYEDAKELICRGRKDESIEPAVRAFITLHY